MSIVFIATSWGSKQGGVNAFNMDLVRGVGKIRRDLNVVCVVKNAPFEDILSARNDSVHIISLGLDPDTAFETTDARLIIAALRECDIDKPQIVVGHDVLTGLVARAIVEEIGGRLALIHHMSYVHYQLYKNGRSIDADEKDQLQVDLLSTPNAALFAVGPLLESSARSKSGGKPVTILIPGLAEIADNNHRQDAIVGVAFGRLDPENDRLKNGRLAIAGFGDAWKALKETTRFESEAILYVLGAQGKEEPTLQALGHHHAGAYFDIFALPYQTDRAKLFQKLQFATVAFMLSKQEGFGLVGWEAISAGIPLILSRRSGLYAFLRSQHFDTLTESVNIIGSIRQMDDGQYELNEKDITAVSEAVVRIGRDLPHYLSRSRALKKYLALYTWDATATTFLAGLSVPSKSRGLTPKKSTKFPSEPFSVAIGTQVAKNSLERLAITNRWSFAAENFDDSAVDVYLQKPDRHRTRCGVAIVARRHIDISDLRELAATYGHNAMTLPFVILIVFETISKSAMRALLEIDDPYAWYRSGEIYGSDSARAILPFVKQEV